MMHRSVPKIGQHRVAPARRLGIWSEGQRGTEGGERFARVLLRRIQLSAQSMPRILNVVLDWFSELSAKVLVK